MNTGSRSRSDLKGRKSSADTTKTMFSKKYRAGSGASNVAWIVADRDALGAHYGAKLKENQLPPLDKLEGRHRHAVQEQLERATKDCSNGYAKGKKSFQVLAVVSPAALRSLDAFTRMERILKAKLR